MRARRRLMLTLAAIGIVSGLSSMKGWSWPSLLSEALIPASQSGTAQDWQSAWIECYGPQGKTYQQGASQSGLDRFEILPFVFVSDPPSTSKLIISPTRDDVQAIFVDTSEFFGGFFDGVVDLRDDGIFPDDVAGDGNFTAELTPSRPPQERGEVLGGVTLGLARFLSITLQLSSGEMETFTEDVALKFGFVDEANPPAIVQLAPNVQRSDYLVNIVAPELLGSYPRIEWDRLASTNIFYQHFPDDFDFVVFFLTGNLRRPAVGSFLNVSNRIEGIGVPIFDDSSRWGSGGRLTGAINDFSLTGSAMTHEIAHNWAVGSGFRDVFGLFDSAFPGHWGPTADARGALLTAPAVLQSIVTRDSIGPATDEPDFLGCPAFARGPARLELYLMGLAPIDAVGDTPYVRNSTEAGASSLFDCRNPESGFFSLVRAYNGDEIAHLNKETIISGFGPRSPSFPDKSSFRAAVITVTDRPLEAVEFDYIQRIFIGHSQAFRERLFGAAEISYANTLSEPTVNGFSPSSGRPGSKVRVFGEGFGNGNLEVFFGGGFRAERALIDDQTLEATVPPQLVPGPVSITVSTLGGSATIGDDISDGFLVESEQLTFPQLALGGGFEVNFSVTNNSPRAWLGTMDLSQGRDLPWSGPVFLNGVATPPRIPVELEPNTTVQYSLSAGNAEAQAGFLRLTGDSASFTCAGTCRASSLVSSFFYNFSSETGLIDSTGVAATPAGSSFEFIVERSGQVNTGFALVAVNPDIDFDVEFSLLDGAGGQVNHTVRPYDGHLAIFFDQLFNNVPGNFLGRIRVRADERIFLVVLRLQTTSQGFQLTSIPAVRLE